MRRHRSPPEKKELSYERDHPTLAEYPHAFRAKWPKRKAMVERSFRRRAKRALRPDDDGDVDTVKRKALWKWPPRSLGERVHEKLDTRAGRIGYNFFKQPYSSADHREPFTRFLAALMTERGRSARAHARAIAFHLYERRLSPLDVRRDWLERYFIDEPEMRPRLTSWIEAALHRH